ncbi:MAG TPA: hypothetical protein VI197_13145 [Polyangiaceae bacterium]
METRAPRLAPEALEKLSPSTIGLCLLLAACGGKAPAATPESTPAEPEAAAVSDDSSEAAPSEADTTDAGATEEASAAPAGNPNETRDVTYKMTPDGLEIEVDGVMFQPKAQPVKVKGGAWGVKVTMTAEGVGDGPRYLLKPKNGVLAFAGSVKRKGAEEKFGDKRDGEESVELAPGAKLSFDTTWPKEGSALWWGDELTIEAGLWGLGKSADALRPVKQFFTLKMVAGNKPQPVMQPPASAQ